MSLRNTNTLPNQSETKSNSELSLVKARLSKIRFLKSRDEWFVLAVPWLGIILSLGFWLLNDFGLNLKIEASTVLLTTLIFADSFHVVFTFVLLATVPELKQWAQKSESKAKTGWLKGLGPWGQALLIGLVLAGLLLIMKGLPISASLKGMATIWLFFELFGPAQHTVAQMRGISLCYNSSLRRKIKFTDDDNIVARQVERIERFLFNFLFAGEVLFWIPKIFLKDNFEIPGIDSIQNLGALFIVCSSLGILWNGRRYPHQDKSNKFSFLVRVLLFPLKMVNMVGSLFIRAAHGTEYLAIYRRMVNGSKMEVAKKKKIFLISIFVSLCYLVPYLTGWVIQIPETMSWTISDRLMVTALLGTFVIRFTHYYLDSVMFKMSDPNTRFTMAPLLLEDPN